MSEHIPYQDLDKNLPQDRNKHLGLETSANIYSHTMTQDATACFGQIP